jgi:hypothetical protein
MLSLIICSRNVSISKKLDENIKETILVDYELIIIDNSSNRLSIFEAYNIGIERSKGEVLVFLHDDILFRTAGWGNIVTRIFNENPGVGLLGIAGSNIKTKMPSTWWDGPGCISIRIVQHQKGTKTIQNKNVGFVHKKLINVAAIDGVLMIMSVDERIIFDTELKGFHNYDLDLSLQHFKLNKGICVTNEIVVEHFSGGYINKDWYLSASRFHKKNFNILPVIIDSKINKLKMKMNEFNVGAAFVIKLLEMNLKKEALYWWYKLIKMKFYSKFHFKFIKKFLFG